MRNTSKTTANFENLTEGQIKQIALMQHLDEDYFICPEGEAYATHEDFQDATQSVLRAIAAREDELHTINFS